MRASTNMLVGVVVLGGGVTISVVVWVAAQMTGSESNSHEAFDGPPIAAVADEPAQAEAAPAVTMPNAQGVVNVLDGMKYKAFAYRKLRDGSDYYQWDTPSGLGHVSSCGELASPRSMTLTIGFKADGEPNAAFIRMQNFIILRQFVEAATDGWDGSDDWVDEVLEEWVRRPDKVFEKQVDGLHLKLAFWWQLSSIMCYVGLEPPRY